AFTPAGSSVWILSCLDGWKKQRIYQTHPFYTNQQGITIPRDIYVFGHFWLQPDTGAPASLPEQSETEQCLSDLITTVHDQYHGHVCGVLGVQETSKGWKPADVTAYTRRAVAHPSLLEPLLAQVKKYPYDCLINDLEDGDASQPAIFSQYDALLQGKLSVPLGQTLLWKTQKVSAYWQRWQDWKTLADHADFFILMALDQDSINNPPVPASIVNYWWIKELYSYMRSIPHLFGKHPVAWELPTYYRLFTQRPDGKWTISSGTDVEQQIALALKSPEIPQNYLQDPNDPYFEYTNAQGVTTFLFFETARSSDILAQTLTNLNGSNCLLLSFWDNDSGTSHELGWSNILNDSHVHLC
ncbi:MAG TPA: hypothetical protein VFN35_17410, partial [Ktedonobacteraceae bacterium]|nr:hypothetical protein [Ktedonobacteraceae bacterium]